MYRRNTGFFDKNLGKLRHGAVAGFAGEAWSSLRSSKCGWSSLRSSRLINAFGDEVNSIKKQVKLPKSEIEKSKLEKKKGKH